MGGFAFTADKGGTRVRYADGEVKTRHTFLFFRSDPTPGPGAQVSVPVKGTSNPINWVQVFGAVAQIVTSIVAIVAIATHN